MSRMIKSHGCLERRVSASARATSLAKKQAAAPLLADRLLRALADRQMTHNDEHRQHLREHFAFEVPNGIGLLEFQGRHLEV
jgi:hypothetical protein